MFLNPKIMTTIRKKKKNKNKKKIGITNRHSQKNKNTNLRIRHSNFGAMSKRQITVNSCGIFEIQNTIIGQSERKTLISEVGVLANVDSSLLKKKKNIN